jgi:hypothetical protein
LRQNFCSGLFCAAQRGQNIRQPSSDPGFSNLESAQPLHACCSLRQPWPKSAGIFFILDRKTLYRRLEEYRAEGLGPE